MYKILKKEFLNETVVKLVIEAPLVAKKCCAGQFVILRVDDNGERIPLTIHDYDREKGEVAVIAQIVGVSTKKLSMLNIGDSLHDFVGPLGRKTEFSGLKKVLVIGGGVGNAIAFPVAKEMHKNKILVDCVIGFRNKDLVILEDEFRENCDSLYVMTDDGSYKEKGLVTEKLSYLVENGHCYDKIIAIGPLPMMKFVSLTCEKYNIPVTVSMNSIMIDGTGMCGCCRLTVDGKTKFACVDGPEFDGTKVDFDEAIKRNRMYINQEREDYCNLLKKINE